jgi:hypothetical protein
MESRDKAREEEIVRRSSNRVRQQREQRQRDEIKRN